MPRSRIGLDTGTHSPWVSRLLGELGHEVIVANARKVRLIGESRKKDDRLDAQTLARLARLGICESMREADVEVILERAKEKYPNAKPRIRSSFASRA